MITTTTQQKTSAKQRLLDAANELFYREGIHTVGIDRVIEHAGVAKASLYNSFGSKEELVLAYLQRRREIVQDFVRSGLTDYDTPREKLLGIFDVQSRMCNSRGYRGCAFANASAETKPGSAIEKVTDEFRAWYRELFTELAAQAGAKDPTHLGQQLHLLYDGASHSARLDRDPHASAAAKQTAELLLDAALR